MNKNVRMWLGIALLVMGLFYQGGFPINVIKPKLAAPEASIIELVNGLPTISDPVDANKLAGIFYAMSEKLSETDLKSNLQIQYFLDFVGKHTIGDELTPNGEKKYPDFSPAAAKIIEKVIGPQTEQEPIGKNEKENLAKLFYGFAWKLYDKNHDDVFESYKTKAFASIAEYNKEDDNPDPPIDTKCPCGGKGYIIHGDGHKTDCPCVESGNECKHNPKCGSKGDQPPTKETPKCQCVSERRGTTCGCIDAYGKCSCPKLSTTDSDGGNSVRRGIFGWRIK